MKNNLIKKYFNKEKIFCIVFIVLAVATFSFNIMIDANDELWNFSNIYKMYYGEEIYKDCNVIVTPLFFYIGEILFKLLGANYLVFRLYNLILYTILFYLIFKLLKKLEISNVKIITYLIIIYFTICLCIPIGANYNILAFIFALLGVIYNIDKKDKKQRKLEIFFQGLILFLVFMSKQSIGLLYLCAIVLINMIEQNNLKIKLKKIFQILVIFSFMILSYIIYLYSKGVIAEFINYTVLGLFEFKDNNILFDGYIWMFLVEIIVSILIIITLRRNKKLINPKIKDNISTLMCFSIPLLLNSYPIFNGGHVLLSSIFTMITIIYFIDKILLTDLMNNKVLIKVLKIFNVISMVVIIVLFGMINLSYIKVLQNNTHNIYYGGIIKDPNNIQNITNYINEQKNNGIDVKILSYKASLYNNILKINNGKFDLPFYGNLGIEGINGIIDEINNLKNTNILITKENIKYQESQKLRDYIINNYEKIGEIEEFYIYKIGY